MIARTPTIIRHRHSPWGETRQDILDFLPTDPALALSQQEIRDLCPARPSPGTVSSALHRLITERLILCRISPRRSPKGPAVVRVYYRSARGAS